MLEGMTLFTVLAKLGLDKTEYEKDVQSADKSGKSLAENLAGYMEKAKKVLVGLGIAAAVKKTATAVWDLAKETSAAGDRIDKQSQALGLSRKAFQEWDYILAQSGASIDSLGISMKTMQAALSANSAETASGLARLGLSAARLQSMSPEDQFEALVRAFQKMPAGAKKSELALQLFGKNAQSLMPLLNSSTTSIDELREQAEKLGLIMSDEDVDASVAFGDALDDLSRSWQSFKMKIGAQFLPGMTNTIKDLSGAVGNISTALVGSLKSGDFGIFFDSLSTEIGKLLPKLIDKAVAVVEGIFDKADELVAVAANIITGLTNGIIGALPKLIEKLPTIVDTIWQSLKSIVTNLGNFIIDEINAVFGTNIPKAEVLIELAKEKWEAVKKAFNDVKEWVKEKRDAFVTWKNNTWDAVKKAFEDAKTWAAEKRDAAVDWINTKWDDIKKAFEDAKTWANEKREAAVNWLMTAWEDVQKAFETVGAWVSNTAHDVKLAITATVSEWIETIKKWLDKTGLTDIALNFISKVSDWIKWIKEWLDGTGITDIALNFISTVSDWIKKIGNWLSGEGISDVGIHFLGTVSGWIKTIQDWITNGINIAVNFFKGAVEGLTNDTGTFQGGEPSGLGWGESLEVPQVPGWGFAKGLNYVPFDGYALLHRGETILNQAQGREWRQNGGAGLNMNQLYSVVANAVAAAVGNIQINMDGRAVGNAVTDQVSKNIYQAQFGRRFAAL